jgi:hypothetical protein
MKCANQDKEEAVFMKAQTDNKNERVTKNFFLETRPMVCPAVRRQGNEDSTGDKFKTKSLTEDTLIKTGIINK